VAVRLRFSLPASKPFQQRRSRNPNFLPFRPPAPTSFAGIKGRREHPNENVVPERVQPPSPVQRWWNRANFRAQELRNLADRSRLAAGSRRQDGIKSANAREVTFVLNVMCQFPQGTQPGSPITAGLAHQGTLAGDSRDVLVPKMQFADALAAVDSRAVFEFDGMRTAAHRQAEQAIWIAGEFVDVLQAP
jgi:hypothetical protein